MVVRSYSGYEYFMLEMDFHDDINYNFVFHYPIYFFIVRGQDNFNSLTYYGALYNGQYELKLFNSSANGKFVVSLLKKNEVS